MEVIAAFTAFVAQVDGYEASVSDLGEACLRMHDEEAVLQEMQRNGDAEGPSECAKAFNFAWVTIKDLCGPLAEQDNLSRTYVAARVPEEDLFDAKYRSVRAILADDDLRSIPAAAAFHVILPELYPCEN